MLAGEPVSRKEFKNESAYVSVLFGDFSQPNFDFAEFDGILSGGKRTESEVVASYPSVLKALRKLNEKNLLLNLGNQKAAVFMELTEQTFLAMANLNGFNLILK